MNKALKVILLVALMLNIISVVLADDAESVILNIDAAMSLKDDILSGELGSLKLIRYGSMDTHCKASVDGGARLILEQSQISGYDLRIMLNSPESIALSGPLTIETDFKVKCKNYDSVPDVKFIFNSGTLDAKQLRTKSGKSIDVSISGEDLIHTLKIVVNPKTETIIGTLDGEEIISGHYGLNAEIASIKSFGIYPIVQFADTDYQDHQNVKALDGSNNPRDLNNTVTWSFESFKMSIADDAFTPDAPLPTEPVFSPPPAEFPEIIRTYPNGRMKAMIMDFDDGSDAFTNDEKNTADIARKYNIRAGFNLVPHMGGALNSIINDVNTIYDGHEIASHTMTHPVLDDVDDQEFINQISESKRILEGVTGREIPGLVYTFGYNASRLRTLDAIAQGYRYTRVSNDSHSFDIPASFYNWRPTVKLNGQTDIARWQNEFAQLDASKEMKVLFGWGHTWEFEAYPGVEGRMPYATWEVFDAWCKYFSEHADTIWNPTPIEFVDYIRAGRSLKIYKNNSGALCISNPSELSEVWVKVSGTNVCIPQKTTVFWDNGNMYTFSYDVEKYNESITGLLTPLIPVANAVLFPFSEILAPPQ